MLQEGDISRDDLKALEERYSKILQIRDPSIHETEELALAARRAYVVTGLESVRLNGALLEENQAVKLRQASVVRNCQAVLSKFLKQRE